MRLVDADALAMKLRHMGYMDENEEVQEVIDGFAKECSGDSISRQAAIDACIRVRELRAYDEIEEIKALPSAEPKTGKWFIVEQDRYMVHSVRCSECNYSISWLADYCPNCGAKMEVQE